MGGESLLGLPLYREPTHYPHHLTNRAAAIKCTATQSNKMYIVNISWYMSAVHLWVNWVWKKYHPGYSLTIYKTFLSESLQRAQRLPQLREFAHFLNERSHLPIVGHAGGKKYTIPSKLGPANKPWNPRASIRSSKSRASVEEYVATKADPESMNSHWERPWWRLSSLTENAAWHIVNKMTMANNLNLVTINQEYKYKSSVPGKDWFSDCQYQSTNRDVYFLIHP